MNTKLKFAAYPAIVLLSLAAAVSAHAGGTLASATGDITPDDTATQVFAHAKTRAQVQQETAAARADGTLWTWGAEYDRFAGLPGAGKTRDALQTAPRTAGNSNSNGNDVARLTGEDSGSFDLSRTLTRRDAGRVLAGTPARQPQQ